VHGPRRKCPDRGREPRVRGRTGRLRPRRWSRFRHGLRAQAVRRIPAAPQRRGVCRNRHRPRDGPACHPPAWRTDLGGRSGGLRRDVLCGLSSCLGRCSERGGGMSDAVERPLQIVHLEDDPNDKLIVRATLKQQGVHCEVASVSTKDEFVRALERADIDLILSDYGLPGFDGLSALAIASRVQPNTPFILVSGTMGEEAAIESLRGGATDYVLKSRLTRLAPAVRRAVEEANERKTRHQTEVTLERERKFLRALLDSLDAGVVACDQDGTLTLFNRATRELHGLEEQSIPPEQWASQYKLYQADGE